MANATNVFAPSIPMRWDPDELIKKPTVDIRPAKRYGIVRIIMNEDEKLAAEEQPCQEVVHLIRKKMRNAKRTDYVLAIGDPVWIAAAVAYQLQRFGMVRMLRWDRQNQVYHEKEFLE